MTKKTHQHPYVIVTDGGTDREELYDAEGWPSLSLALDECRRLNKTRDTYYGHGFEVMARREDGTLSMVY